MARGLGGGFGGVLAVAFSYGGETGEEVFGEVGAADRFVGWQVLQERVVQELLCGWPVLGILLQT